MWECARDCCHPRTLSALVIISTAGVPRPKSLTVVSSKCHYLKLREIDSSSVGCKECIYLPSTQSWGVSSSLQDLECLRGNMHLINIYVVGGLWVKNRAYNQRTQGDESLGAFKASSCPSFCPSFCQGMVLSEGSTFPFH